MYKSSSDPAWMSRAKWLTQALILSGTLNIGLLATFIYFVLKEKHDTVFFEMQAPAAPPNSVPVPSNQQLLRSYSVLSFQELLLHLSQKELVEEGYAKRDLALACLVAFHHFHIERALGGLLLQRRHVAFTNQDGQERIDLTIFPGLADYQYEAIMHYAKTEKWPFTAQGLFFEIKRTLADPELSLLEAFSLTPECHAISLLFAKSGIHIDKGPLIAMLAEGDWKMLSDFVEQQRQIQDFTVDRRRALLLRYFQVQSKIAARILFETDQEYMAKRFDDPQIISLLDLLHEKTPQLAAFAKALLSSPRSDAVWKKAATKCPGLTVEKTIPVVEKKEPAPIKAAPPPKAKRTHVVEEGENLWKIARKYRTTPDALMRLNHLETDRLRPGKKLEIPES
jgi:hypothetical protein